MTDALTDEEFDRIQEEAAEAALHAWSPNQPTPNPYATGSREWACWDESFRRSLCNNWQ